MNTLKLLTSILLMSAFYSSTDAQNGDTINQIDKQGLKQGYWIKKYPDGMTMYEGYFKNNKPVGTMKRYFESGSLKAVMEFNANKDTVEASLYYENGNKASEGAYLNNKKEGEWKYYSFYDTTLKSVEHFLADIKDGKEFIYYENGQVSEEITWDNGVKHGLWKQFFVDGKPKLEGIFQDGKLNGTFKMYYPNGYPEIIGYYKENLMHGTWLYFNDEGKQKTEIKYTRGQPDNEDQFTQEQQDFFDMIEKNRGKFSEPDPADVMPPFRGY